MSKWSPILEPRQFSTTTGSHLTRLPGVRDSSEVCPGMAYFADTGPAGKTCGDCAHRGYYRTTHDDKTFRTGGCRMFPRLAGRHGPPVKREWLACKYFEAL